MNKQSWIRLLVIVDVPLCVAAAIVWMGSPPTSPLGVSGLGKAPSPAPVETVIREVRTEILVVEPKRVQSIDQNPPRPSPTPPPSPMSSPPQPSPSPSEEVSPTPSEPADETSPTSPEPTEDESTPPLEEEEDTGNPPTVDQNIETTVGQ